MKHIVFLIIVIVFNSTGYAQSTLPAMGEGARYQLKKERAIGAKYFQKLQKSPNLVKDELVNFYLNEIMNTLLQGLDRQYRDYHLSLIRSDTVNAFALPGGYLGLYTGLVFLADNEGQLAGVLAHEISHVALQHGIQLIQKNEGVNIATMASLFLALAVSSQYDGNDSSDLTQALAFGGVAGGSQAMINFTRENEYEADRKGMSLMVTAGYPKIGIAELFAKLEGDAGNNELNSIEFLRTHPVSSNRMAEAYQFNQKNSLKKLKISNDYDFFKIYLNYLLKGKHIIESEDRQVQQYQYSLNLLAKGQVSMAKQSLLKQFKADNSNLWIAIVLISLDRQQGHYKGALKTLNQALSLYPDHKILWLKKIELLIDAQQLEDALLACQDHRDILAKTDYFRLMEKIYSNLGKALKAKEMEADYFQETGLYERALYVFKFILTKTNEPTKQLVIKEKIRNMQNLIKEQNKKEES